MTGRNGRKGRLQYEVWTKRAAIGGERLDTFSQSLGKDMEDEIVFKAGVYGRRGPGCLNLREKVERRALSCLTC